MFISHDFGVVAALCDRVHVMYAGRVVESGLVRDVLRRPRHPYTQRLLACVPELGSRERRVAPIPGLPPSTDALPPGCAFAPRCHLALAACAVGEIALSPVGPEHAGRCNPHGPDMSAIVLEAKDVARTFPRGRTNWLKPRPPAFRAVDGVSLTVSRGRTLGIVGESGCGKSTMARMMVGLLDPTEGTLTIDGDSIPTLGQRDRRALYRRVQMVFQDPIGSLNPRKTVREILSAPLAALKGVTGQQARNRVAELMDLVSLRPDFAERYPHEFSGGQSQRIGIARALAAEPDVIVLDEPVSALDVSVQAQVLQLLGDLQSRARADLCIHLARPRRGGGYRARCRRNEERPYRRVRPGGLHLCRPAARLYAPPCSPRCRGRRLSRGRVPALQPARRPDHRCSPVMEKLHS